MGFFNSLLKNVTKSLVPVVGEVGSSVNNAKHTVENVASDIGNVASDIGTGLQNFWYKSTGQSHLTSEYQHEEQLANTAYQRAAEDMQKAGLSKYIGVGAASSPSPNPGNGLLSTALALQQLKAGSVAIKEQAYNLSKAQDWGVPTTAVDQFAKWDALAKLLFGGSVDDLTDGGGLLTKLYNWITGNSDGGSSPVTSNAASDAAGHVLTSEARGVSPQPRVSSDASGPYRDVFDKFSHNIGLLVRGNYGSYVPKNVVLNHDQVRDNMKGALKELMNDYDLPYDSAAKIVNLWTKKILGNWKGIDYDLFITGTEMPSVPSSSSYTGGGYGGGGGFAF